MDNVYSSSLAFNKRQCRLTHTFDVKSAVVFVFFFFKGRLRGKELYYYDATSDAETDDIKHTSPHPCHLAAV